jgi:hypothetical protein
MFCYSQALMGVTWDWEQSWRERTDIGRTFTSRRS